jgi:hypothetical protein
VIETLDSERCADMAVPQVHATVPDEGRSLCSPCTMYRVLDAVGQGRERHDQLRHPTYTMPELLAYLPNQAGSWDITKLKGPAQWNYFHLYVILDHLQPLGRRLDGRSARERETGCQLDSADTPSSRSIVVGSRSTQTADLR